MSNSVTIKLDIQTLLTKFRENLRASALANAIPDGIRESTAKIRSDFSGKNALGCNVTRCVSSAANSAVDWLLKDAASDNPVETFEIIVAPEDLDLPIKKYWKKTSIGDAVIEAAEAEIGAIVAENFEAGTIEYSFASTILKAHLNEVLKTFKDGENG